MPLRFDDFAVVLIIQEDPDGFRTLNDCHPGLARRPGRAARLARVEIRYASGTRIPTGATITCTTPDGKALDLEVESLAAGRRCTSAPATAATPTGRHGQWKGAGFTERVTYDLTDPAVAGRVPFGVIDHVGPRRPMRRRGGLGPVRARRDRPARPRGFADWFTLAP